MNVPGEGSKVAIDPACQNVGIVIGPFLGLGFFPYPAIWQRRSWLFGPLLWGCSRGLCWLHWLHRKGHDVII